MTERTRNPDNSAYHNYGGRGITVCERWTDFANFAADMGPTFDATLELDRRDVSGGYCPENCRWVTHAEQQRNRRNNHVVNWAGRSLTVQDWSEMLGVNPNTVVYRLRRGWPVERALTTGADLDVLLEIANGDVTP